MITQVFDGGGALIAEIAHGQPLKLLSADGPQGREIASWLREGVPGLKGTKGDPITERNIVVPPEDPHFGLALLEQFERRGWTTKEAKG